MTQDGAEDLLEIYRETEDFQQFEASLMSRPLKRDNRIITVDNSILTLANIDATMHTYKTQLEDKLKVVVVDYMNQIASDDPYSWQVQIEISKKLKALAKKYEVVMFSPFQTSEEGKVRFSKGILDSPNWAFNLSALHEGENGAIEFECKKSRGDEAIDFASEIHWPTLKILPHRNLEFEDKKQSKKEIIPKTVPNTEDDLSI